MATASFLCMLILSAVTNGHVIQARDTLALTISPTPPSTASDVVDHGYMGLGISGHTFPDYAGSKASPNTFSRNLIQTIADRTGSPVYIRAGGTSFDHGVYVENQAQAIIYPPGTSPVGYKVPRGLRFGPSWYEGFENFPGVQWTHTAHLANNSAGMMNNSVLGVQQLLKHVGSNLEAIEIGNEPNFYNQEGMRPRAYDVGDYIDDWNNYSTAISTGALAGTQYSGQPIWRAINYYNNNCKWCVANTIQEGLASSTNIKSIALHNYMILGPRPAGFDRQRDFMNHTKVMNQLNQFKGAIKYLKNNQPNVPFHLSEINSATYSVEAMRTYIGVFGSALWLVDYLLYGASLGVARMNVQQSTGFSYSSWRPITFQGLPPAVLPPYYAHPFVADVIGNSGDIKIVHIPTGLSTFSAYAVYDAGSLKAVRIVLVNLLDWTTSSGTARPETTVSIKIGNQYSKSVVVDHLTAPSSDELDSSQITWKGTSWTYASNGRPVQGQSDSSSVQASKGKITVTVKASEAILLTLH